MPTTSVQLYSLRDAIAEDLDKAIARVAEIGYENVEPYAFVERATDRRVLLGHCVGEVGTSLPYLPFVEMVAALDARERDLVDQLVADHPGLVPLVPRLAGGLRGDDGVHGPHHARAGDRRDQARERCAARGARDDPHHQQRRQQTGQRAQHGVGGPGRAPLHAGPDAQAHDAQQQPVVGDDLLDVAELHLVVGEHVEQRRGDPGPVAAGDRQEQAHAGRPYAL